MSLQVGVGVSEELDEPVEAVAEALEQAYQGLNGQPPKAAVVFASFDFDQEALVSALQAALGDLPLVGCTTDGEISSSGLHLDSLSIMLISGDDITVSTTLIEALSDGDPREKAHQAMQRLVEQSKEPGKCLLAFPDCSFTGFFDEILDGLKSVVGSTFPIFGGAPADRARLKGRTWQYFQGRLTHDSAPLLLLGGALEVLSGLRSGVQPFGRIAVCTKAQGNLIQEIDHKPALEHHKAYLGEDFATSATIAQFPYVRPSNELDGQEYYVTQPIFTWIPETGALISTFPLPTGSSVKLGLCTRENILRGSHDAAEDIREQLDGRTIKALFCFSCSGRKQILGMDTPKELSQIQAVLGKDVPTLGFYCYGELGPLSNKRADLQECRVHGYSISMLALV